jgi:hypothetical protein
MFSDFFQGGPIMKNLKSMGLFMGILLCAILFSACAQDIPDEAGGPGIVPDENDGAEPETEPKSRPRPYDMNIQLLTKEDSAYIYTREDFPEVPPSGSFWNSAVTERGVVFEDVWVYSREEIIEVIRLLNEREDVERVSCYDLREEIALERAFEKHGIEILDTETKWQIQQDLYYELVLRYPDNSFVKRIQPPEESFDIPRSYPVRQISIEQYFNIPRYYGTYDGYVVIVPSGNYGSMINMVDPEIIDGIRFDEPWISMIYRGIIVWKDGSFSTMTELYEQGILTREDLLTIKDTYERVWEAVRDALNNYL